MLRVLAIIATMVSSCGAADAQSATGIPALPAASPLGILGSGSASGSRGAGIPLGATEIDPGGLSPAANANCPSGGPMVTATGMGATFDGGGFNAIGSAPATAGCATSNLPPSGTASPLPASGTRLGSPVNGGTIPLGATAIDGGGISPLIGVSPPSSSAGSN
jgi:hypothetical protein